MRSVFTLIGISFCVINIPTWLLGVDVPVFYVLLPLLVMIILYKYFFYLVNWIKVNVPLGYNLLQAVGMVYLGYLLLYLANNYIYNELNLIAKFIFASFIVIGFVNVIDVWGEWGILNKYFTFVKEKLGVIFIFFWPYFMVTYQITSNKFDFMLLLVLFLLMMLFRKYFDVWFAKLQQNENMFFKWLNKFVLFMFWVSIIFVSVAFIGYILFTPTDIDVCIDYEGVWDYYENRCRFDCTSWTKESGCVKIEK